MSPKKFQKSNLAIELKAGKKRLDDALHGLSGEQCKRAGDRVKHASCLRQVGSLMIVHNGSNGRHFALFVQGRRGIDGWTIQKCSRINAEQMSGRSAAW
jgi:hypothetical protein